MPDAQFMASRRGEFSPSPIAGRGPARWEGLQAEIVQATEIEPFDHGFPTPCHLLIASERGERNDGETPVEGSNLHDLTRKLTFIPAGSRFDGWQKPRVPTRRTYFYIDPCGPLLDPELGFGEIEFQPRLLFFDANLWQTAQKLKAQVERQNSCSRLYAEALIVVLCHELVRVNDAGATAEPPTRGGLAGWQQKRIAQQYRGEFGRPRAACDAGRTGTAQPLSFRPRLQALVRGAAASLPHDASHRAGQDLAGQNGSFGHGDRAAGRIQSNERVHDEFPQTHRREPDGISAKPRITSRRTVQRVPGAGAT